jgi:hypothetical protein
MVSGPLLAYGRNTGHVSAHTRNWDLMKAIWAKPSTGHMGHNALHATAHCPCKIMPQPTETHVRFMHRLLRKSTVLAMLVDWVQT